ncbi:DUF4382 domain-containing protein [Marinoscillum sp. 108]|jgi:hypothetical protein|uniref:DUF4382 domain-containing protein n=1 Tax=Marinoscillum sp. 108 TaxID=2653151 RepID=UPI0013580081|nr:DUF4382 domain-containing protein [Marinoscillum sp. 108]
MKTFKSILAAILIVGTAGFLMSCESELESKGTASIGVTDAAVDAENISGVYLKVNEVQATAQGKTKTVVAFDSPKTFNVMDYQNGATYDLGEGQIDAGSYSELRFILDEGSYVKFKDGTTADLDVPSGTTSGYKVKGDYEINSDSRTNLVVDIDLRKAFVKTGSGEYKLRPTARIVNKDRSAVINGTVSGNTADKVVVYAYEKGTYKESETAEPADGESRFENSINSAVVANGQFTMAYMEEGEYDLIAVAYDENPEEDTYAFRSASEVDMMVAGSLLSVLKVEANANINVLINLDF